MGPDRVEAGEKNLSGHPPDTSIPLSLRERAGVRVVPTWWWGSFGSTDNN